MRKNFISSFLEESNITSKRIKNLEDEAIEIEKEIEKIRLEFRHVLKKISQCPRCDTKTYHEDDILSVVCPSCNSRYARKSN